MPLAHAECLILGIMGHVEAYVYVYVGLAKTVYIPRILRNFSTEQAQIYIPHAHRLRKDEWKKGTV